jgi:hypothetical protein
MWAGVSGCIKNATRLTWGATSLNTSSHLPDIAVSKVATAAMDKVRDDDTRNALLLGVAGVAIAAALGIACQKRISETLTD